MNLITYINIYICIYAVVNLDYFDSVYETSVDGSTQLYRKKCQDFLGAAMKSLKPMLQFSASVMRKKELYFQLVELPYQFFWIISETVQEKPLLIEKR